MSEIVILAPHVDDEAIGCYRALLSRNVSKVIYFFEWQDPMRHAEAIAAGIRFGFTPVFLDHPEVASLVEVVGEEATVYVPNIADTHHDHKWVNMLAKFLPNTKRYYSVDMNVPKETLPTAIVDLKQNDLVTAYPTQAALFSDKKYSIFESLLESDLVKSYSLKSSFNYRFDMYHFSLTVRGFDLPDPNTLEDLLRNIFPSEGKPFPYKSIVSSILKTAILKLQSPELEVSVSFSSSAVSYSETYNAL